MDAIALRGHRRAHATSFGHGTSSQHSESENRALVGSGLYGVARVCVIRNYQSRNRC
jgi:hypothetical protein